MARWINSFWNARSETKQFVIICVLFGIIILGVFIFAFARLDSARSYPTNHRAQKHQEN